MGLSYQLFLKNKSQIGSNDGFKPLFTPDYLYDFQKHLVEWSLLKGRSAIFADCGLGKTPMQLVWGDNVVQKTNRAVLALTPLAVADQTIREAEKFGIKAYRTKDGSFKKCINVTNYERLHYYNPGDFAAVVCDESSAIKAFDGKRRRQVTRFLSKLKYRLLCSATPAPNDYVELGTSSEALGDLVQSEMITNFFRSSDKQRHNLFKEGDFWNSQKWFLKPHADTPFWRWVASWARALQKPSDLGDYDDGPFVLPELKIEQHIIDHNYLLPGEMFTIIAKTLREQRAERRVTIKPRCDKVAELVSHNNPAVVWCQYNDEGNYLEKIIPDAIQVAGRHSDDEKEERLKAFSNNEIRVLVTKPRIGGWGLNWQHCGHHVFFPSHSFEQYYQSIRRSYRFGRTATVKVDIVTTKGERGVTENLKSKQMKAEQLFDKIVSEMANATSISSRENEHTNKLEVPSWLLKIK